MKVNEEVMYPCPFCGGELIWGNDFMANEVSDDYDESDDAICSFWTCSVCGRDFEVTDPPMESRFGEYSDYWFPE